MTDLRPRRHKPVRRRNKPRPQRNVDLPEEDEEQREPLIGPGNDKAPPVIQAKTLDE